MKKKRQYSIEEVDDGLKREGERETHSRMECSTREMNGRCDVAVSAGTEVTDRKRTVLERKAWRESRPSH
jgi:hypothetical protein